MLHNVKSRLFRVLFYVQLSLHSIINSRIHRYKIESSCSSKMGEYKYIKLSIYQSKYSIKVRIASKNQMIKNIKSAYVSGEFILILSITQSYSQ